MAKVSIPAPLRALTGGETQVTVGGGTVREVIEGLEAVYPGIRARLVDDGRLRSGLAVFVDGDRPRGGLDAKVGEDSEVYFAPAIAGGGAPS